MKHTELKYGYNLITKNQYIMESMKKFYWRMLLIQTIVYALFYLMVHEQGLLTNDGRLLFKPVVLFFYGASVLITFVIPMVRLYLNQK